MREDSRDKPIALEAYERLAERYAALVDTKPENAYLECPATLSLLPDVKSKHVLDAGCGPGSYSEWLVNRGAKVVAFDISPTMVKLTQQRLGTRVKVSLADLSKPLSFLKEGFFDIVLSALVLDYIKDWKSVFSEFYRVLREDGLLIFSAEHPFMKFALHEEGDYFDTELVEWEWRGFGIRVKMPSYCRSLYSMISPLLVTGFTLEKIIEPRPTKEFKLRDPETYEKLSKRPGFICIRARKDIRKRR